MQHFTFMICFSVSLQAPSLVMANAVETLMGDMKMLDSGLLPRASCLYSDRPKRPLAFDSSHTRGLVKLGTASGSSDGPSENSGLRYTQYGSRERSLGLAEQMSIAMATERNGRNTRTNRQSTNLILEKGRARSELIILQLSPFDFSFLSFYWKSANFKHKTFLLPHTIECIFHKSE